jgi:pimeloyl-ACP methyl ester carboxylesterase
VTITAKEPRSTVATRDGALIHFKDWGAGTPIVFSHGWPLTADAWEAQMLFFADRGFRCIAHDRRGHGRSSQPWNGNDMDTYSDDLATLMDELDLHDATLIGHSTGGGEVTRFVGRHGTKRVARIALVSAVPPLMLRTPSNPKGQPIEVFDGLRSQSLKDRSQLYLDLARGPFFGFNRPGSKPSEGAIQCRPPWPAGDATRGSALHPRPAPGRRSCSRSGAAGRPRWRCPRRAPRWRPASASRSRPCSCSTVRWWWPRRARHDRRRGRG